MPKDLSSERTGVTIPQELYAQILEQHELAAEALVDGHGDIHRLIVAALKNAAPQTSLGETQGTRGGDSPAVDPSAGAAAVCVDKKQEGECPKCGAHCMVERGSDPFTFHYHATLKFDDETRVIDSRATNKQSRIDLKGGAYIERSENGNWRLYHASTTVNRMLDPYLETELADMLARSSTSNVDPQTAEAIERINEHREEALNGAPRVHFDVLAFTWWPTIYALLARSATAKPISGIRFIKELREQRDRLADVLRWLDAHGGLGLDKHERITKALEGIPTYEQQLRNIAKGIGMEYDDLIAALNKIPSDSIVRKGGE